jgi:hypothetical protein
VWCTVFVIDQKEHLSDKDFPAFQPGGKLFLKMRDAFSASHNQGFVISEVFYDLHSKIPKQYVYLRSI